jgi:hypothetical protein
MWGQSLAGVDRKFQTAFSCARIEARRPGGLRSGPENPQDTVRRRRCAEKREAKLTSLNIMRYQMIFKTKMKENKMINIKKKLKKSRQKFLELRKAHRIGQYETGAEAYEIADILSVDDEQYEWFANKSFWSQREVRPQSAREENRKSLIFFALDLITRYKDPGKIWKRVRGLDYLSQIGTRQSRVVGKIIKVGGWENLAKLAAAKDPRRARREVEPTDEDESEQEDESDVESVESLSVLVQPELAEAAREVAEGRKVKVVIRRLPGDDLEFVALRILPVKAKQRVA